MAELFIMPGKLAQLVVRMSLTSLATPLDLSDYAAAELRFSNAYMMNSGSGKVEASTDGTTWTTLATYTGLTSHWNTEQVSIGNYL